ncbi:uncharacterized protein LOC107765293 [Nicotiana tabacum]|uniref:uncharacterized protein LOC107765293 n=1 Tax=Nicotiana tabacum TaxID=4097 RepID=UPI003F4E66E1
MRHHELEFVLGGNVVLKVLPMKGIMCFSRTSNFSPCYVVPYEINKKVGNVAYELELLPEMSMVHLVFYVSIVRLYRPDHSYILSYEEVKFNEELSYEEEHVQILDRQVRRLRANGVARLKSYGEIIIPRRRLGMQKMT